MAFARTCSGTNKAGEPCGAPAIRGSDLCLRHTEGEEAWRERARRGGPSDPPSYPGWTCEYVSHEYEFADIRCTSGIKVVRFQTGS
jgi:hypothetical protein